jgi:hypothetical protein
LREGGYGVTIALQAALVDGTAIAAEEAASEALLLNACYPDAVNALLAKRNRRVLAGIGNIAILQAILADPPAGAAVRVLAHHYHLGAVSRRGPCIAPRIWIGRQELPDPLAAISDLAAIRGAEMNQVTGACTAAMLNGILSAEIFRGHLCGPLGMPGGYPVRVHKGAIELDLPPTISPEAAMAFNVDAARAEGVVVVGRHVTFTGPALSALTQVSPSLAVGFDVKDLDLVVGEFVNLREKLRCM